MWRFLKKLEIELPYDPSILVLGIHIEEIGIERDSSFDLHFTESIFERVSEILREATGGTGLPSEKVLPLPALDNFIPSAPKAAPKIF